MLQHIKTGINFYIARHIFVLLNIFPKFVVTKQKKNGKRQNSICVHELRIRFT